MSSSKIVKVPMEYANRESKGDNALLAAFIGREALILAANTLEVETCDSIQRVILRYDIGELGPVDMILTLQMDSPFTRSVRALRKQESH